MLTSPDTPAARAAAALLAETSAPWLTAHCWRTWHFGEALLARRVPAADRELAFVGAMLHDLGLTERYDGAEPFELTGAAGAEEFAATQGWAAERVATLGAAVGRHLDLDAAAEQPEIAIVHLGSAADVAGLRLDDIPDDLIDAVLAEHPRADFAVRVRAALDRQVLAKPSSRIAALYTDYRLGDLIGQSRLDAA